MLWRRKRRSVWGDTPAEREAVIAKLEAHADLEPSEGDSLDHRLASVLDTLTFRDPAAKAAMERTEEFLSVNEMAERVGWKVKYLPDERSRLVRPVRMRFARAVTTWWRKE